MKVCVVGLGKIGLPLAVQFARSNCTVIGADISDAAVETINGGSAPFPGEAHLDEYLAEVIADGSFKASTDTTAAVAASEVVVIVVPLIVDTESRPDFVAMDAATRSVAAGLQPGTLVSYETTLPVGTTRNRFTPMLAELSGLEAGREFFVCFSPERVYSGRIFADLRKYPKLVGGIDAESAKRSIAFYEHALQFDDRDDLSQPNGVWDLGSAEASELAKLAETTYRDINIGFANELAKFSDTVGIDVRAVIEASNSQPFSHIHQPGISVGGHCIPVYPRFYLSEHPEALIPAAARTANTGMPAYAVKQLGEVLGGLSGKTIAVLGIAYRGGVKESAFSGVFGVVEELKAQGATPVVEDPLYTDEEIEAMGFTPFRLGTACDGAVIQTDHVEYAAIGPDDLPGVGAILDGRKILDVDRFAGIPLYFIGAPPVTPA